MHMIVHDIRYMDMIVMISKLWMLIGMTHSISYDYLWYLVYGYDCLLYPN